MQDSMHDFPNLKAQKVRYTKSAWFCIQCTSGNLAAK